MNLHLLRGGLLATISATALYAQTLDSVRVVEDATVDTAVSKISGPATRAFWLPGIGTDFRFVVGGSLTEFTDGTARLTGVIARDANPNQRFEVDVKFARRTNSAPQTPKLELNSDQYAPFGSIDVNEWYFYKNTYGILRGLGEFEGGRLKLTRRGPAFQLGMGASGYNALEGASGWVNVEIKKHPNGGRFSCSKGDININLDQGCPQQASAPAGDRFNQLVADQALWLDGIGLFVYVQGSGAFIEKSDGTATLTGLYAEQNDPRKCFFGNISFTGYVGPNDPVPAGSPKPLLKREAYKQFGGPVDTSTWHYYTGTEGYLQGCKDFEGAVVKFGRKGEAFQVGEGASGMNVQYGAGGWIEVTVCRQPNNGDHLTVTGHGDINIDLGECPNGGNGPIRNYGDECGPTFRTTYTGAPDQRFDMTVTGATPNCYGYLLVGLDEMNARLRNSNCYLLVDYCQRLCIRVNSQGEAKFAVRLVSRSAPEFLYFQYLGYDRNWRYETSNGIEVKLER